MTDPMMCPYCGDLVHLRHGLTRAHPLSNRAPGDPETCPGSEQNPRNPWSDRRPLWNGQANPHLPQREEIR